MILVINSMQTVPDLTVEGTRSCFKRICWPLLVYSNAGIAVRRSKETRKGGCARSLSWEPNSLAFQKLLVLSTVVFPFGCIGPRVRAI
ncbi:hypothetical protein E1A91_A08G197200v1 [Gossypium mustelinum]|uniref:Uncharacterized protein n=1 Tax=Gossypium mustelinum TaxID=34275 RepID=A0A5D2YBI1_GOSMU|nr:hypothetical protein E1A91_A08G197200v1 [Gossypium mustelinum]